MIIYDRQKMRLNGESKRVHHFKLKDGLFANVMSFLIRDPRFIEEIKQYDIIRKANPQEETLVVVSDSLAYEIFLRF